MVNFDGVNHRQSEITYEYGSFLKAIQFKVYSTSSDSVLKSMISRKWFRVSQTDAVYTPIRCRCNFGTGPHGYNKYQTSLDTNRLSINFELEPVKKEFEREKKKQKFT